MKFRALPAEVYADLKTASRTLREKIGKQDAAASLTRVSQSNISRYESRAESDEEFFSPIDVIADLEVAAGAPIVTRRLAALTRHVLVRLPQASETHSALGRVSAEALKEVGDVFSTLGAQLADGRFTAAEYAKLRREIGEAIVKLLQLEAQAAAEVDDGGAS